MPLPLNDGSPQGPLQGSSCSQLQERWAAWSFSFLQGRPRLLQQRHSSPGTTNIQRWQGEDTEVWRFQPDGHGLCSRSCWTSRGLGGLHLGPDSASPLLSTGSSCHTYWSLTDTSHFNSISASASGGRTQPVTETQRDRVTSVPQNSLLPQITGLSAQVNRLQDGFIPRMALPVPPTTLGFQRQPGRFPSGPRGQR